MLIQGGVSDFKSSKKIFGFLGFSRIFLDFFVFFKEIFSIFFRIFWIFSGFFRISLDVRGFYE